MDIMASYTRRAHSGGNGPAMRQPRTAYSGSNSAAGAGRTSRSRIAQEGSGTAGRPTRSRHAASHKATSHRAPNRKKNGGKKGKHRVLKWVLGVIFGLFALGVAAAIAAFAYLYTTTEVPQPEKFALAEKTSVYYADGTTPIGSYAEQNRVIISCDGLPDYIGNAIVASENRTFYTDKGLDLRGIARAFWNNVTTGTRQGGSTITQQYAERYYLGETTTYSGKAREAILAIKIAQTESKDEVLCNYMNTIYLGRNSYGIQAAAKAYFNKDAKDLTLSEAAMIAGIIPSPSTWDPADNPDIAKSRFKRVINIMSEDGYISSKQKSEAKFPDTAPVAQQNDYAGANGYLLDMVERELVQSKAFTKEDLDTGGYKIITTIEKDKQDVMQSIGDTRLDDMPESLQIGGIALNPKTGAVLSVYAGSDYLTKQLNNCDQAVFEPGSTMKPFALLGAAQSGVSFDTLFNGNSHQHFAGLDQEVNNALENNWGNIDLYHATANSVNTVFMNINEHLTPQRTAEIAHEAGIQGDIDADSMYNVLGINALTVWDLAQGHSTIANNGKKNTIHMVARVLDAKNKDLYNAPSENEQVFDANDCALVQKAMQGTTTYGTAAGVSTALGRPVAGKSGTANDEMASSFVGYTPSLMNVWAIWNPDANGNPQVVPAFSGYGVSSTGYPAHLFQEYMTQALAGTDVEQFPTAKDNGKIGGSDGTWGLGRGQSSSTSTDSNKQSTEDAQKKAEQEAQQKAADEAAAEAEKQQQFAQQCLNDPTSSTDCPNYPGNSGNGNGSGTGNSNDGTGGDSGTGGNSGSTDSGKPNGNSGSTDGSTGGNGGNS
ncbi:penicillin-binding protein [Bifidobacterium scaligerum]|uniref:Penicillin-binding protein n=2 Tax=Bifidobacterium scaligerum TaxID=2052656 RepID=A0A2M9HQL0_9BIFI|nr:penicillin-binding protein [Bifidobacterium scaligerum]